MRTRHQPQAGREPGAIIPGTSRKALGVDLVREHGVDLIELRGLTRHADGRHSASGHRTVIRREALPDLIAALAALLTGGRR